MPRYKYILFDFDGTTADTDGMLVATFNILFDMYRNGVKTPPEQIYYYSGPPIAGSLKKEFPDMDNDFIVKEFTRISREMYKTTIKSYPHCKEVLEDFKKHGIRVGLVTSKMREMTLHCLKLLHFEDLFEVIIGYDDVKIGKPHPEGILKALDIFGAKDLKEAVYIGDNRSDLEAANNAGIDCGLVAWGPRVLPPDVIPTFKFQSYEELRRIIYDEHL